MFGQLKLGNGDAVALPTEGVDRNLVVELCLDEVGGRPPHGGRG